MKSKKTIKTLVITSIVFIGLLLGNQLYASASDLVSPDGGKEAKKEQPRAKTDKKTANTSSAKEKKDDFQPIDNVQATPEEEYIDPNNPHNNFDCSKAGFDRE